MYWLKALFWSVMFLLLLGTIGGIERQDRIASGVSLVPSGFLVER